MSRARRCTTAWVASAAAAMSWPRRARRSTTSRTVPDLGRRPKPLALGAALDDPDHLVGVVGRGEEVEVGGRDERAGGDALAQPVHEATPERLAHEHDGEVTDLARLDEQQRLEQLVERPEPAGKDDERAGVA